MHQPWLLLDLLLRSGLLLPSSAGLLCLSCSVAQSTNALGSGQHSAEATGGESSVAQEPEHSRTPRQQLAHVTEGDSYVLVNLKTASGDRVHLRVHRGKIVSIAPAASLPEGDIFDASELFAFPAFVDSHVHLSYFPRHEQLAQKGVLAAIDLAAPIESLAESSAFLHLLSAGPMVTSLLGYPTQSWGRDGYGLEVDGVDEAEQAVTQLLESGATLIKMPLDGEDSLSDAEAEAVVGAAHRAGVKVAVHALSEESAARAAALNCDVLAHTPTAPLSDETVAAWKEGTVISTLGAFGAADSTVSNLRRLHEAGARVLYGTDLGNTRTVGIDVQELLLLEQAGLTREEALAAGTSEAARFWGLEVGLLQEGLEANFLLLSSPPELDPQMLGAPSYVIYQGRLLGP